MPSAASKLQMPERHSHRTTKPSASSRPSIRPKAPGHANLLAQHTRATCILPTYITMSCHMYITPFAQGNVNNTWPTARHGFSATSLPQGHALPLPQPFATMHKQNTTMPHTSHNAHKAIPQYNTVKLTSRHASSTTLTCT